MSNSTYVFPTVVINFVTYTAKRWGQFPSISYSNGATAGSEVVTVDSDLNIDVQIEDGVSTNAQIKAAIDATAGSATGLSAGDLVGVSIAGGHTADANVTVKNAFLSGGTDAAAARLTIGHLVYTAVNPGVAGNNIRVKYTSGGSLSVSVSSNDITVQLKNDGSSTNALIRAAIIASMPASALVTTASDGLALSFVPTTAMAPSFLNLSGGIDDVAASVTLQDLTFTSTTTGPSSNDNTITYTTGGTAGSEVVTVDVDGNVSIQIENGVSTATEIKTACDDEPAMGGTQASGTITVTSYSDMIAVSAEAATGTVTIADWANLMAGGLLTITIHGVGLDANGGGNDWSLGANADDAASNLATAINNNTGILLVTGNAVGSVVTITANTPGTAGNSITLATTDAANAPVSGPTLTGGVDAVSSATITVGATTLTEGTDFDAEVSNDQTATNIAAAIDPLSNVHASAALNVVTVTADAYSTSGNSIAFSKTGSGASISGSGFLAGGLNGFEVAVVSGTGSDAQSTVNGEEMDGAVGPNFLSFYSDNTITALTSSFVYFPFNNVMRNFNVYNDETSGTKSVIFSFDGTNISGEILPTENAQLYDINQSGVFLKYGTGAPAYRVFATGPR